MVISRILFGLRGKARLLIKPALRLEVFSIWSPNLLGSIYRPDRDNYQRPGSNFNLAHTLTVACFDRLGKWDDVVARRLQLGLEDNAINRLCMVDVPCDHLSRQTGVSARFHAEPSPGTGAHSSLDRT